METKFILRNEIICSRLCSKYIPAVNIPCAAKACLKNHSRSSVGYADCRARKHRCVYSAVSAGEDILETARRELQEETGAIKIDIKSICVYSVTGRTRVNETGEETHLGCCALRK